MATPIAMPKLGITMEEGTVVEWPNPVGTRIEKGQVVLIIESEKAEVEIESPASGFVRHRYVEPGDTVPCGTLLAAITSSLEEDFDPAHFEAAQAAEASAESPRRVPTRAAPATPIGIVASGPRRSGKAPATPAARVRARTLGIDVARVVGTGPGGRVVRADVEDWAERLRNLIPVADGVSLDVPRQGAGPPLLLLPGLGTDVSVFAPQIAILAGGFEVFGVNPRGVAGSDAPDLDCYSVATAAADVVAVVDRPAHVVGASLGAAVAIEVALSAPERVRSLTLITPFVAADPRLGAVSDAWVRLAGAVTPELMARALLPWFFSAGFLADAGRRERVVRGLAATVGRVPEATVRRSLVGLEAWSGSRSDRLGEITAPTLVIAAGGDLLTPKAEAIGAAIPGARCLVVPDAGHAVTIECPDEVGQAILGHVSAHS